MRKFRFLILFLFALAGFSGASCRTSCHRESPLERERRELQESFEGYPLIFYRAIKISLRATPLKADPQPQSLPSSSPLSSEAQVKKLTSVILAKIFQKEGNSAVQFSPSDLVQLAQQIRELKKKVKSLREDDYPTLLEQFSLGQKNLRSFAWNSALEHLALSIILEPLPSIPPSFKLYELSLVNIDELPLAELKVLTGIWQGILYLESRWFYLAEESLTQSIDRLEKGAISFSPLAHPLELFEAKISTAQDQQILYTALSYGMRGFARFSMKEREKNPQALADFEKFLDKANKLGMQGEIVWLVGCSIALQQKEESDRAIKYLQRLKKSPLLGEEEKKKIGEIIAYLHSRKPDRALAIFSDQVVMTKILSHYVWNYLKNQNWYARFEKSEAGPKTLRFAKAVDQEYQKMKNSLSVKKVKELL